MSQVVGQQEAIQVQMSSCPPENSAHYEKWGTRKIRVAQEILWTRSSP